MKGRDTVEEWSSLISQISHQIPPLSMHIEIVCSVKDLAAGLEISKPLRLLPQMAGASIWLGPFRHPDRSTLKKLAKDTARGLTSNTHRCDSQQLKRLSWWHIPSEIRLHILSCTDLTARSSPVEGYSRRTPPDSFSVFNGRIRPRA